MTPPQEQNDLGFAGACVVVDLLASMISVFADHGATLEDLYDLMLKNVRLHLASAPNGDDLMVALVAAAVVKVAEHRQVS